MNDSRGIPLSKADEVTLRAKVVDILNDDRLVVSALGLEFSVRAGDVTKVPPPPPEPGIKIEPL